MGYDISKNLTVSGVPAVGRSKGIGDTEGRLKKGFGANRQGGSSERTRHRLLIAAAKHDSLIR
jgi:hypothetical protein